MNKRTKLAIVIGAIAAVVSAVILIVIFWDRLLELCPFRKKLREDDLPEEPEAEFVPYTEEESADFADLEAE